MYVEIGKAKSGLTLWRCTRGSSKNEAANLVLERSMHTTGKMTLVTATGQYLVCGQVYICVWERRGVCQSG